jgi:hypothetical protein
VNCFRPEYDEDALASATETALAELGSLGPMRASALETAREHDLAAERKAFGAIVARVDELWASN